MTKKKGKSWELLLNVFTESFVLNPTLKHIGKFRLHVQNQQKKSLVQRVRYIQSYQIYSKLTIKTPERCLVLLLLNLKIFRTIFYYYYY